MLKPLSWLLIAALGASLAACDKPAAEAESEAPASRGLKVQAYDAPTPKAPLGHKLETAVPHPEAVAVTGAGVPVPGPGPAPSQAAPEDAAEAAAVRSPPPRVATRAPAAPPATEPHRDLYADEPDQRAPPAPDQPGFRLTVPLCRRARSLNDPLARTPECAQLIDAARAQAEACRQAFEDGDDETALSPACRQAAGFR